KEEYTLKEDIAKNLKLDFSKEKDLRFFRAKGCTHCYNLGYLGRTGIAEVLLLVPKIRDLVLKRAQEYLIKQLAQQEGMTTLREEGMKLARQGITTLEEVLRVTSADE
ncbi:MAG: hypothetical protein N2Z79_05055, partial [Candidatus Omnitrophica bacterium]|nr:hypothetical protein [Candidatus Omnitrophota bacterium]